MGVISMDLSCCGDVVEANVSGSLWESVEIVGLQGKELIVCSTGSYPGTKYSIQTSCTKAWDGTTSPMDTRKNRFQAPIANLERVGRLLESAVEAHSSRQEMVQLFTTYGLTIEHLLNLGFRCDRKDWQGTRSVQKYCVAVVATMMHYLKLSDFEVKPLKFALKQLAKSLDRAAGWQASSDRNDQALAAFPTVDAFLSLGGVSQCVQLVVLLQDKTRTNSEYFAAIRLIPMFHGHLRLPSEAYERFITEVLSMYESLHFCDCHETKHTIRFIEELDYCFSAHGLKRLFSPMQQYALKRTQISLCVEMIRADSSRFDSIEYFSALLKANCRDTKFQSILREFSFSVLMVQDAIKMLPEYLREYFLKICCMGNFSVASILSTIDTSEAGLKRFLSVELFEDLLRYKSTDFLLSLPPPIVKYCIDHYTAVEEQMIRSGVDFQVLAKFFPAFQLTLDNCIKLAHSAYTNPEKAKLLHEHFETYSTLIEQLDIKNPINEKEKGVLLSLYFNVTILEGIWIRERSRWRRVPVALFVKTFSDFY